VTDPTSEPAPDLRTIADLPFHVLGRHPKPLLIGRCRGAQIEGQSTREWFDDLRDLALGLSEAGIQSGDRVAIVSESRPEWLMTDMAILAGGAVTVPVYPTLSSAQAQYILQDCGARLAFVSNQAQLEKLQAIRHQLPALEAIVVFEEGALGAAVPSPSVSSFAALRARGHARMLAEWGMGRAFRDRAKAVKPDDLATIIYTSGTTGEPKGVMLTHHNLATNMMAAVAILRLGEDERALSFLPLSHSFERMLSYVCLSNGIAIVFAESTDTIPRDILTVRPTLMTGVPRVFEKLEARIVEKGAELRGPRRSLFKWAIGVGRARGAAQLQGRAPSALVALQAPLADRLVWSKIRENLGGQLRNIISGSAPLSPSIAGFFQGIGLPITEGYGLTETSPVLTGNPPGRARLASVGTPIPGVEIRIAEDGEILARGPNIMKGYYNKPDATAEVIRDGWFHTGDIGRLDSDGYLYITDRKKDLIITAGGKNVAPQPIEAVLKRSPLVAEAVLIGDRRKFISALIVPEFASLERRLRDLGRPGGDRGALVDRDDVVALYQEIVDALNRELAQFERIKKFRLLPREFSIDSGELTPTLKVRRRVVETTWRESIEKIYR
jgi:long-chain acyl-CoA synthetase